MVDRCNAAMALYNDTQMVVRMTADSKSWIKVGLLQGAILTSKFNVVDSLYCQEDMTRIRIKDMNDLQLNPSDAMDRRIWRVDD